MFDFGLGKEYLYGYVRGNRFLISNTVEQICAFLIKHKNEANVVITDVLDQLEIEASQGFILNCPNQDFLKGSMLDMLSTYLHDTSSAPKYIPYTLHGDYIINNVRFRSNAGYFLAHVNFENMHVEKEIFPYFERASGYYGSEDEIANEYPDSISMDQAYTIAGNNGWID